MNPLEKVLEERRKRQADEAKMTSVIKVVAIMESFQELCGTIGLTPDECYDAAQAIATGVIMQRNVLNGGDLNDLSKQCIDFANGTYKIAEEGIKAAAEMGFDMIKLGKAIKKQQESGD